ALPRATVRLQGSARGAPDRGDPAHWVGQDHPLQVAGVSWLMFDLGTSFLASVARDPDALAIADGAVRLIYREWYRRISSVVAGLDMLGLKPGDHIVTVLTNCWEAATLHWACQFAGIIVTPVNWRANA